MLDQSQEAAAQLDARWVQITDADGVRMAKSDEPSASADTLAGSALVRSALQGEPAEGFIVVGDTVLADAVTVPIRGAGAIAGVLMAVTSIDASVANLIKENAQGNVDVAFFVLQQSGKPRLFASTLERTAELEQFIAALPEARDIEPSDSVAARTDEMRQNPHLGGEQYVALAEPLRSASGAAYGGLVILRSRDAEFAAFKGLRRTILFGGLVGLLLAALASAAVARQITRPIGALVDATRRAADGDYAADIEVTSSDEIGRLATAFRSMLNDCARSMRWLSSCRAARPRRRSLCRWRRCARPCS